MDFLRLQREQVSTRHSFSLLKPLGFVHSFCFWSYDMKVSYFFKILYVACGVLEHRETIERRTQFGHTCMKRRISLAARTLSNKNPVYCIMRRLLVDPLRVCLFFMHKYLRFSFFNISSPVILSISLICHSVFFLLHSSSSSSSPTFSPTPPAPLSTLFPSVFPTICLSRGSEWFGSFPYSVLNVCWW